jgi:hypothetical protein
LLKARAPAAVGVVHKTPDKFVVHPKGKWLEADAGEMVQINVAKYFLVPVTQADADYCLATKCVDHQKKPIRMGMHFKCLLGGGKDGHEDYVAVGDNTGNISKHAKKHHQITIDAIVRIIKETPAADTAAVVQKFVSGIVPETSNLTKYFKDRKESKLCRFRSCCSCLVP